MDIPIPGGYKTIIDISLPLHNALPVYPGDPPFVLRNLTSIGKDGSGFAMSSLNLGTHTGTHIDAPSHVIAGAASIDLIPSSRWISAALVIDIPEEARIEPAHLAGAELEKGISILFKTNCSHNPGGAASSSECPVVSMDTASLAVSKRINLLGIDGMSIEDDTDSALPVHNLLLGNDVLIVEGLSLHGVTPGKYTLFIAPLRIRHGDGSPARAFLLK